MKKPAILLLFFIGTFTNSMSQVVTGVEYFQIPDQLNVSGPYLGQDPPGMTAKRFPPDSLQGNNNWWWHGSPIFTPDGLEMFWCEYVRYSAAYEQIVMFTMKVENNNWGPVHRPLFGDTLFMDNNPVFSAGGDTLYFFSTRPGGPYFMTTRAEYGWTPPSPVDIPIPSGSSNGLEFAVNRNGDFFIELSSPPSAPPDIYVSRLRNGNYQMAEKLGPMVNSDYLDGFPFVDPDENYLIFASNRPDGYGGQFDLYICFRNEDSTWTSAMNMGYEINSTGAWFGTVTLDKQYLFFNTARPPDQGYNPYWISAAVIDSLHNIVGLKEHENPPAQTILYQNQPNPFRDNTVFSFQLEIPSCISLVVLDLSGNTVATLINQENLDAGKYQLFFSPGKYNLPSGMYQYSLFTNNKRVTKKMICLQ